MASKSAGLRERLAEELKAVLVETGQLLEATAGETDQDIGILRTKVNEALRSAQSAIGDFERDVAEKAGNAAKSAGQYVGDNPLLAIGMACGLGLVAGWILGKK